MLFNQEVITVLQNTIRKEGAIVLPSEGNSMFPLIQQGDICRFKLFNRSKVKKGDILLFWTSHGKLVAHRLYKFEVGKTYICKGDTNLGFDEPIKETRILGTLISIQKPNRVIQLNDFTVKIWSIVVRTFPIIPHLLRIYLNRRL